jgi:hypothetical protein
MIRQQKRQQSGMGFTLTVQRDVRGYEVRRRVAQAGTAETTLAGGGYYPGDKIVEIVGKSGRTEPRSFSTNQQRPRIWTNLRRLTGPSEIARFMTKWAPLDVRQPQVEKYCSNIVTAQDICPEALCVSGDAERIYQDFRFLGDGLDDVPALLFGSGDE